MGKKFFLWLGIFLLFLPVLYVLAPSTNNTTMTWIVPSNKSHTLAYGGSCSATAFFFHENEGLDDPDSDGNWQRNVPKSGRAVTDANCQSSTVAGITVTNNGNLTIDVNAAFTANIDTNLWLKVWQGNGSGCGTNGLGGWAQRCQLTVNNPGLDLNDATGGVGCRDYNSSDDLVSMTLAKTLLINDTNQLCFSGDGMGSVANANAGLTHGDHNGTFQTSSN